MWFEKTVFTFLMLFLVAFFGIIASNGIEHGEYKKKFKSECERKGGVMFLPKGVKGWPSPECRNPSAFIHIGGE